MSKTLFSLLLFLYFLSASGEFFHVFMGIFKPKIGHVIAFALLGVLLIREKGWHMPLPLLKASLFILGSALISASLSSYPERCFVYIGVYLFHFVFYFLLPFQILQTIDLKRFFQIYWSSFVVVGIYATLQVVLSIFGIYDPMALQRVGDLARGQAWMYEPSYYALYMIPYVMFHNALFLFQKQFGRLKLLGQNMFLVVSTSTGLIISYPTFFGVSWLSGFTKWGSPLKLTLRKSLKRLMGGFLLGSAVVAVFLYEIAMKSFFKFFYFGLEKHQSFYARWHGIVTSWNLFCEKPLFGAGLGGVGPHLFQNRAAYDTKIEYLPEIEPFDPTNCLTEVLASLGLVGMMAFIYLAVQFYRAFYAVVTSDVIDEGVKKGAIALFLSLIVTIVALQMNQGLFRPYVWIHAAVVYGFFCRSASYTQTTSRIGNLTRRRPGFEPGIADVEAARA